MLMLVSMLVLGCTPLLSKYIMLATLCSSSLLQGLACVGAQDALEDCRKSIATSESRPDAIDVSVRLQDAVRF